MIDTYICDTQYLHLEQLLTRLATNMHTIGDLRNILVGRISAFARAVCGESPVDIADVY